MTPATPRPHSGPDGGGNADVRDATLTGGIAIVLWSALALLTTMTGAVPPFLLVALAFGGAFCLTVAGWLWRGGALARHVRWPWRAWLLGVGGLFGYHFFYFFALRRAPAAEASLINYLWPLLIVVFSSLLPGERLRSWHVAGALLGLAGTALLVTGGRIGPSAGFAGDLPGGYAPGQIWGFVSALAAAVTWAGYSVLSRRLAAVPSEAVGAFCGATALLATMCHVVSESTVWPAGWQWLAVLAMAAGPVGYAFFAWDVGMKRGDIRVLGACGYLTPLLSTGLLVAFGRAQASWLLASACLLISGGAALAARDVLRRQSANAIP